MSMAIGGTAGEAMSVALTASASRFELSERSLPGQQRPVRSEAVTRIVAGSVGGRRIRTPRGAVTRPTSERVREALFSTLESLLGSLEGVRFLDLFAGSGAVGLEAVSRGASQAVLVEQDRPTAALITRNAHDLGLHTVTVVPYRVDHYLRTAPVDAFDVVFCDPPYALPGAELHGVVDVVVTRRWLAAGAVVALERSRHDTEPMAWEGLHEVRQRRYGDTVLWYGRASVND